MQLEQIGFREEFHPLMLGLLKLVLEKLASP